MNRYLMKLIDKRISEYQNDLMAKHAEEVQNIYREMRGWRHDYHNHIQAMLALIKPEDSAAEPVREYLLNLNDDLEKVDTVIKTGNIMVDAILNSKLSLARSKKISVDASARVSERLDIADIDLCVIIGNLLDNAIEACSMPGVSSPFIRIYIGMKRTMLYIIVTNSSGMKKEKTAGLFKSGKNSPYHGLGLKRIDRLCEKYGGYSTRASEEGAFTSEVLLPALK